jgi:hypothetical protein
MSFSGAAFSVLYLTSLALMASMMSPPQTSLVAPGMSGFSGVQPAVVISPPVPAGTLVPGSGASAPPPPQAASNTKDVTAATAIARVLTRMDVLLQENAPAALQDRTLTPPGMG